MSDRAGRFLRGWFVDAGGGDFRARPGEPGRIEVHTERGSRRLVYLDEGALLLGAGDELAMFNRIDRGERDATFSFPWPRWPVTTPLAAFATGCLALIVAGRFAEKKAATQRQ